MDAIGTFLHHSIGLPLTKARQAKIQTFTKRDSLQLALKVSSAFTAFNLEMIRVMKITSVHGAKQITF